MDLEQNRRTYASALRSLERFDGKFLSKLSQENLAVIREAVLDYGLMPQQVQAYSKTNAPYVCLNVLRDDLRRTEELIHEKDTLASCPAAEEYAKKIEELRAIETLLTKESGMPDAARRLVKHGLSGGSVTWR